MCTNFCIILGATLLHDICMYLIQKNVFTQTTLRQKAFSDTEFYSYRSNDPKIKNYKNSNKLLCKKKLLLIYETAFTFENVVKTNCGLAKSSCQRLYNWNGKDAKSITVSDNFFAPAWKEYLWCSTLVKSRKDDVI